jgi:hypothetical protein
MCQRVGRRAETGRQAHVGVTERAEAGVQTRELLVLADALGAERLHGAVDDVAGHLGHHELMQHGDVSEP